MNYLLLTLIQILQPTENLRNYQFSFFFRNLFILFQIEVEIRSRAKLKYGTKTIIINLNGVKLLDYTSMIKFFMNFSFPYCMLDVILFNLFRPTIIKVMNLACNLPAGLEIEGTIHFRVATFA